MVLRGGLRVSNFAGCAAGLDTVRPLPFALAGCALRFWAMAIASAINPTRYASCFIGIPPSPCGGSWMVAAGGLMELKTSAGNVGFLPGIEFCDEGTRPSVNG